MDDTPIPKFEIQIERFLFVMPALVAGIHVFR